MSRSVIWARPLSDNALLTQHDGLSHMAEVVRILLNEAMKVERAQALHAEPYERSAERRGYANGFKPKTVSTRLGRMQVAIPQVRGEVEFYPSALERGVRSERALKLVVAEMYVQGVSTRKVTEVMQQLCGLEVSMDWTPRLRQPVKRHFAVRCRSIVGRG